MFSRTWHTGSWAKGESWEPLAQCCLGILLSAEKVSPGLISRGEGSRTHKPSTEEPAGSLPFVVEIQSSSESAMSLWQEGDGHSASASQSNLEAQPSRYLGTQMISKLKNLTEFSLPPSEPFADL